MQISMNMFSALFIMTKVVISNMVDALLLTYVLATMAGLDHAAVNVYHCQAVNMVTANQKHFNAFVTTRVDGREHFVINVSKNYPCYV